MAHIRVLEMSLTVHDNPATVTAARRLYITGLLTRVDISNPQSTQDTRTYLLYNDMFMYCQKIKQSHNHKKDHNNDKTHYKGIISLRQAEITPLSAENIAKISKVKKTSGLSSFMRKSSDAHSQHSASENGTVVYGFELYVNEPSIETLTTLRGDGLGVTYSMPGSKLGSSNKRQYIMRTQTEAEQNAWISLLRKASLQMSRRK